jgi:hypothetical protein
VVEDDGSGLVGCCYVAEPLRVGELVPHGHEFIVDHDSQRSAYLLRKELERSSFASKRNDFDSRHIDAFAKTINANKLQNTTTAKITHELAAMPDRRFPRDDIGCDPRFPIRCN